MIRASARKKSKQRVFFSLMFVIVLMLALIVTVQAAVVNGYSAKVLNVHTNASLPKSKDQVSTYEATGHATQNWYIDSSSGHILVKPDNLRTNAVNRHSNGNIAFLWPTSTGYNDSAFSIAIHTSDGYLKLANSSSNAYLTQTGTFNGAICAFKDRNSAATYTQKWTW